MIQVNKNELYINGMTNKVDTINSIIDNIDNNDLDTAKDSLNQLKEVEEKELYGTRDRRNITWNASKKKKWIL